MAVYDRWHLRHPVTDHPNPARNDKPCKCGRGKNKLYPSSEHGIGKRWQVRYNDDEGKPTRRNFDLRGGGRDETDPEVYAEAFDAKIRAEVNAGTYTSAARGKTLLRDYAARWRETQLHRDSTADRIERAFRNHVDPLLGDRPIASIRASDLRAWVKDRAEVLAPSTLAVVYGNLAGMFNAAVIDRDIGVSPCAGVRLPDAERKPHYIPTPAQVHTLADAAGPRYRAAIYLGAGCGLRVGETMGMETDQIDYLRREVDVSQQLKYVPGRGAYIGKVKTKTSARTCELPQVASVALAEHVREVGVTEVELADETDPRRPGRRVFRLLFATPSGGLMYGSNWWKVWARARAAAGMPEGVGFHCLRHYFATLLIHNGASVKTVQLALGHATPMITLNEYVGVWPEPHERTRSIVDSALGETPRLVTGVR